MTSTTVGRPIVVGVDGSTSAVRAARWAATVAAQRHRPLRLVFANNCSAFGYAGAVAPPQSYFDELEAAGELLLAAVETEIRREHPELVISVDVRPAGPIPALMEESDDARLLVLGARGTGGFRGILAGSTAVALVAHGHCPVAVIRGGTPDAPPRTDGPVVVGVDGSPTSDAAVAAAFDEASWRGAELVALYAWHQHTSDPAPDQEQAAREILAERLAGWQEKYPDVVVRRVLARGRPAERLLETATAAQLIVVGSRGHGGFSGLLLGSTSQALIQHATCSLLVVRPVAG